MDMDQQDLANIIPVTTELPIAPMVATASPVPVGELVDS